MYREGGRIILQAKEHNWDSFFFSPANVSDDLMQDRNDSPPQERDLF